MTFSELQEFIENNYEMLEDETWENYSLLNGILAYENKMQSIFFSKSTVKAIYFYF